MMERDRSDETQSGTPGRKRVAMVYVERSSCRWVVLDPDGQFWILPGGDDPWPNRIPFEPTTETPLDSVPGHYKIMLGLPF